VTKLEAARLWSHSTPSTGKRFFSMLKHPELFLDPASLISNGYRRLKGDQLHKVPRLRINGAVTPFPHTPPHCSQWQLYLYSHETMTYNYVPQLSNTDTMTSTVCDTNEDVPSVQYCHYCHDNTPLKSLPSQSVSLKPSHLTAPPTFNPRNFLLLIGRMG
jgi:hypothetical protein